MLHPHMRSSFILLISQQFLIIVKYNPLHLHTHIYTHLYIMHALRAILQPSIRRQCGRKIISKCSNFLQVELKRIFDNNIIRDNSLNNGQIMREFLIIHLIVASLLSRGRITYLFARSDETISEFNLKQIPLNFIVLDFFLKKSFFLTLS